MVLSLLLAWPAAADAQRRRRRPSPETEARERALQLFEQSVAAYQQGELQQAVDLLVEARGLYSEPVLSYNLGRAYEGLGRSNEAADAYQQYLDQAPDAEDRGAIEQRIVTLRNAVAERERLEREQELAQEAASRPPSVVVPPATARNDAQGGVDIAPWIVAGSGVVVIGLGGVFGLLSQASRDEAVADPVHTSAMESFATAEDQAVLANVLFVAGGVIAAVGVVWAIVDLAGDSEGESDVAVVVGPMSVSVRARLP